MAPLSPVPVHPLVKWLTALGPALVIAYAFGGFAGCLVALFEGGESPSRINVMPLILAGQGLAFVVASMLLLRTHDLWRRVGLGFQAAGYLLLAIIPLLLIIFFIAVRSDASVDQGGSTAAFFMLILFGGYYGIQGVVLWIVGLIVKKRSTGIRLKS